MHYKKISRSLVSGAIAAAIAFQTLSPSISVLADETTDQPVPEETTEVTEEMPEEIAPAEDTELEQIPEETDSEEDTPDTPPVYVALDAEDYIDKVAALTCPDTLIVAAAEELTAANAESAVAYNGTYVLSYGSIEAYNEAVTEAENQGLSYLTSDQITICGTPGFTENEPLNPDGTVKVAVIDTGSNNANEAVSVIGDDPSDYNGHGTSMCNYILENAGADVYILSVKAISDSGTGSATDVYTAIQYVMEQDVDILLLPLSMKASPNNDLLSDLIETAAASEITVIASAGNNNADAGNYIPANNPGVITVGALDEDGYKLDISNYGDCVDYYIKAGSTSEAAAIFAGKLISGDPEGVETSYKIPEETNELTQDTEEGSLTIEITPITLYDDNGFAITGTTVSGNHVRVTWSFGTHYWSSTTRSGYRSSILSDLNSVSGLSNVEVTFYPQATSGNYSGSQGGYQTNQVLVEFDVESIQDIVGGSSFYNAVTKLYNMGDKSYAGGIVVISWDDVATAINNNQLNSASSSGYTVQTQNGWVRRVCHGPYNRPYIGSTTYCSEPGVAFNDNYTVTVYSNTTSGDVPVAALGGVMAVSAARVLASSQSEQAKQGYIWTCKGLTVATPVASDPGDDAFPVQQYDGGTVSLNMTSSSTMVNGELFAVPGGTYTFTDSNNQIGNYTASSSYSKVSASISGNTLTISVAADADPTEIANTTISLNCDSGYDGPVETEWHLYVYESSGQDQVNGDYQRKQAHYNAEPWSIGLISEVYVDIVKSPANTAIVATNNCYSLEGTTYGLYTSDGTWIHTFIMDSTGNTEPYKLTDLTKSYYVKEISAGKGYYIDTATYNVKFEDAENGTVTFSLTDVPMSDPLNWNLVKVDNKGWDKITGLTLAGAKFTVSYYDTTNVNSLADALALTNPYETVTLTAATDATGATKINVSSSDLGAVSSYFGSFSVANTLPLGTYVVREVSAPEGYNSVPSNAAYVLVLYKGSDGQPHKARYSSNSYFYSLTDETAQIYEPAKVGYAKFYKESTVNSSLSTIAPSLYDLSGTKYEVYYTDSNKLACTITFEKSGKMSSAVYPSGVTGSFSYAEQKIELPAGSYYAKEVQTGNGFYLNSESQYFTVTENQTASVTFEDEPMYADFDLVLTKLVEATGISQEAADKYSVEGAVFCVNYYNELVPEADLDATTPAKSWFFETDKDGKIYYLPDYLTSTSKYLDEQGIMSLFTDDNGEYMAPQGTYTITEISAPENLEVNANTYIRYITLGCNIVKGSSDDPANKDAWTLTIDGEVIVPETPFLPSIDTVALASDGSKEIAAAPDQTITDTVSYMNLISGYEYKLKGELYLTDGTPLGVTAEKTVTFTTAGSVSGTVNMDFQLDATDLEGKTIVVVEDLYILDGSGDEILFVSHNDLTDKDQQITIPDIETTLLDTAIDTWDSSTQFGSTLTNSQGYTKHVSYGTNVTLTDYVLYTNLVPGYEYTVTGTLKNKDTGADILDSSGNPITGSVTFTATASEGYVEVIFTGVDTTKLAGTATVAFETLQRNGIDLVVHADLTDEAQTLPPAPEIKTTATEEGTGNKVIPYTDKISITDTVSYKGLIPGKTYEVTGTLYNADTGAILTDSDGKAVKSSVTFTPDTADGTVEVIFTDVYVSLDIDRIVVFENLYYNGIKIAMHADLEDEDQTVTFEKPEIKTNATEEATGTKLLPYSKTVTILDEVTYEGPSAGKTYKVTGTLVNADTGEYLTDENGVLITSEAEFTPEAANGSVTVTFEDVYVPYSVTKVVVFEMLYYNKVPVAIHADITDEDQTVRRASASTLALSDIGNKTVVIGSDATIVDTITYEGLETGMTYKATGTLYKKDGTQVLNEDGSPVTSTTEFVPEAEDGTVTVEITFNTASFTEEDSVVVFENIYYVSEDTADILIAKHEDLEDEDQTIGFVSPDIPSTGEGVAVTIVAGILLIALDGALIAYNIRKKSKKR